MNWWLNFYFAEGPGIEPGQPKPTGWRLLLSTLSREWWNLIVLNLVFVAACLPLITAPAAVAALFRVTERIADDQPCDIFREFRLAFISGFGRATIAAVLMAALLSLGGFAVMTYAKAAGDYLPFVFPLAFAFAVQTLLLIFGCNLFYLLANKQGGLAQLIKAAALSVFVRPLAVLAALAANAVIWLLHVAGYPSTVLFAVLANFSFGALLLVFALREPVSQVLDLQLHGGAAVRPQHVNRPWAGQDF